MINNMIESGKIQKRIEECYNQIDEHKKEIRRLNNIINQNKEKDFFDKVTLKNKYYKFTYDYDDYYGIITNFWYHISDEEYYVMNFCGFGGEFLDVADGNWFFYDAMRQFYIKPFELNKFINTFEEITEQEFWKKHNDMLEQSKIELERWIIDYQNEKEE